MVFCDNLRKPLFFTLISKEKYRSSKGFRPSKICGPFLRYLSKPLFFTLI